MRKIVLFALLLACAVPVWGQRPKLRVEWGVVGGINIPGFSIKDSEADIKNKLGWQAGIVTAVNFGVFAVEPQIFYMRQGLRIRPKGAKEVNLKSSSIDVPVLFSLRILKPLRLFAGPVFTVMNDSKQKTGGDLLGFGRVRPTLSYTAGVGVVALRHMLVEVRYNGQFSGKKNVVLPDGIVIDKIHANSLVINLGYIF